MEARIESMLAPLATDTSHSTSYSFKPHGRSSDFTLPTDDLEDLKEQAELPRSASSPHVPSEFGKGEAREEDLSGAFSFSEEDLIPAKSNWPSRPPDNFYNPNGPSHDLSPSSPNLYSTSPEVPADSKITVSRALLISEQLAQQRSAPQPPSEETTGLTYQGSSGRRSPPRSRTLSRTLTSLSNRRSRLSRNSSPEKPSSTNKNSNIQSENEAANGITVSQKPSVKRRSWRTSKVDSQPPPSDDKSSDGTVSRSRSLLTRRGRPSTNPFGSLRPFSGSEKAAAIESPLETVSPKKRPATPLPLSFSNSSLPSLAHPGQANQNIPPLPGTVQSEYLRHATSQIPKKKDELWNVFRTLDGDFQK